MRKVWIFVSIVAFAVAAMLPLAACSGEPDDPYAGHWVCSAVDPGDGQIVHVEDVAAAGLVGEDLMWFDLQADGTAKVSTFGGEVSVEPKMTWSEVDNGNVEIVTDGGESMVLQYNSEEETLEMNVSGQKVFFAKQEQQ